MANIEFYVQLKPEDKKRPATKKEGLAFVRANFNGGRFLWATGELVKREGFTPERPGKSLKRFLDLADDAVESLEKDHIPVTNETLSQRMKLMHQRILWNQSELSVWLNDRAETFSIPDSVDKTALEKDLKSELTKLKPDLKKVINAHLTEGAHELFGFWNAVLEGRIKPRFGKKLRPSSISTKRQTYKLVRAYNPRLTFADMDMKFYNDFTRWMEEEREHLPPDERRPEGYGKKAFDRNNIGKHIKELKAMLHLARKNEMPVSDKFTYWSVTKESNEVVALSKEEVAALMGLKLDGTKKEVRDIFIMACFLGPRIGDFPKLVKDNFVKKNGQEYFDYIQEKTGARATVPVFPQLAKFLKDLDQWPTMISEQNFRENLKAICKAAGMEDRVVVKIRDGQPEYERKWEAIGPHSSRRTFASALYYGWWAKPLPASLCMRFTGHKSEKSFMRYIGASEADLEAKTLEILDFKTSMKIA